MQHYLVDKFYLLEVKIDNGFKGTKFVLHHENLHLVGLNTKDAKKYISTDKTYSGFFIRPIKRVETNNFFIGVPEDIKELLNKNKKYFQCNIRPILGEILIGEYKGFKFSLFGKKEVEEFFNTKSIRRNTINRCCVFKVISHREAIPYHNKLTPEIKDVIAQYTEFRINTFAVIGTVINGKHKGMKFGLIGNKEIDQYFNNGNVHSAVNGRIKQAYNCTFERVTPEEAMAYRNRLNNKIVGEIKRKFL